VPTPNPPLVRSSQYNHNPIIRHSWRRNDCEAVALPCLFSSPQKDGYGWDVLCNYVSSKNQDYIINQHTHTHDQPRNLTSSHYLCTPSTPSTLSTLSNSKQLPHNKTRSRPSKQATKPITQPSSSPTPAHPAVNPQYAYHPSTQPPLPRKKDHPDHPRSPCHYHYHPPLL
jgi:hypothetical protein